MTTAKKYVYLFEEGSQDMNDILGGKGAGLAEMTNLGLNVPPGFIISTEACVEYLSTKKVPGEMWEESLEKLKIVEEKSGKKFGDEKSPLLVSVRSGAPVSMPGMMDTILNVGLNDVTVKALAKATGNSRFAYDSYRRLIQMFGSVVLGISHDEFEDALARIKQKYSKKEDFELSVDHLKELIDLYNEVYKSNYEEFPQDPLRQLRMSIEAVFNSWNTPRAIVYRKLNDIPEDLGTAVSIVSMVFGNMGNDSATGVAFTRDPSTGEKNLFSEYLVNAQGEDVVAGIRTPKYITDMEKELPNAYESLLEAADKLERHYKDVQDIEYTIEKGKFYILQTRSAKRTAKAEVRIAVDMVREGLLTKEEALLSVNPESLDVLMHPQVKKNGSERILGKGLAASPGAAIGSLVFSSERALELAKQNKRIILCRPETTADDVRGMSVSEGFLTQKGGMTSHAAVVSRAMGKPAVVGAESITVNQRSNSVTADGVVLREGDIITVDGTTGEFFLGAVDLITPTTTKETETLLKWADEVRKIGVRANANTPEEARISRENGAEGVGLVRTERMFLGSERISIMRGMIMSSTEAERKSYLEKLLPMQISDFVEFFRIMEGYPVVIRLLDPPLHEFLPDKEELLNEMFSLKFRLSKTNDTKEIDDIVRKLDELNKIFITAKNLGEFNPMLGFRGCRLGLTYPEIYDMQVTAIITAAIEVASERKAIFPEIMIPLIGEKNEIKVLTERLQAVAKEVAGNSGIHYKFGTMIEIPRACLLADKIAEYAEFFSFGTNDLTQLTFGYSRDDAEGKFMAKYLEDKILPHDPFATIDRDGVGEMMKIGVERGRATNNNLEIGICGEQGGDPETVEFCHEIGLDYVSASPFRIPIARLSAARAAIKFKQ